MTVTNHAVTGILIATVVKQPALALPLAFLSHFAIDMVPHWIHTFKNHFYTQIAVVIDLTLAVALTLVLAFTAKQSAVILMAASFLSVIPDAMWATGFSKPADYTKKGHTLWTKAQWFFHKIQWSESQPGIIIEALWLVAILVLILKLR